MEVRIAPILEISPSGPGHEISICFTAERGFIASGKSAWRFTGPLAPNTALERLSLPAGEVQQLSAFGDALYLLKTAGVDGHTLLRSMDQGESFEPIDEGLVSTSEANTRLVPTRVAQVGPVVFTNAGAGRNFLSCNDGIGQHWNVLSGERKSIISCYPAEFLVFGRDVLLGGECPTDDAFLLKGALDASMTGWAVPPAEVGPPDLGNRDVQFIAVAPDWGAVFAGVEGGLLRSTTAGRSWTWPVRFTQADGSYPYVKQYCRPKPQGHVAVIGGHDKPRESVPYLAISPDKGLTWVDVSKAMYALGENLEHVLKLTVDPEGHTIVATRNLATNTIALGEIVLA